VRLKSASGERRKWARLPLAIPVFVRSRDEKGKELLEFATALNVSAGGMLVAVRRAMAPSSQILLEIPSAPLAALQSLPKASRNLRAKAMRAVHADGYHLLGLKFDHPLLTARSRSRAGVRRRKLASIV
jgi:PilZ domain-containing protein